MCPPVQTVASAAGGGKCGRSLICIWDVQNGMCLNTISYHRGAVQSLAFSRDDRFILSAGQYNLIGWYWSIASISCKSWKSCKSYTELIKIHKISQLWLSMTLLSLSAASSQHPVGDFSDSQVALWSSKTFQLLSSVDVSGPIHDTAFSPSAASQLACVGSHGVYFCFIQTHGLDVDLKVNYLRTPHVNLWGKKIK